MPNYAQTEHCVETLRCVGRVFDRDSGRYAFTLAARAQDRQVEGTKAWLGTHLKEEFDPEFVRSVHRIAARVVRCENRNRCCRTWDYPKLGSTVHRNLCESSALLEKAECCVRNAAKQLEDLEKYQLALLLVLVCTPLACASRG